MARNERDRIFSTGERDLAGEQEPGRGAGGRGTAERDLAGEQVITQGVNLNSPVEILGEYGI